MPSNTSSLEENAKEFAKKVVHQTMQDLISLKNVVSDTVSKFQNNINDTNRPSSSSSSSSSSSFNSRY
ncbi:hypothetical protein HMI55_005146 [Coelomomyces lativittatus]|nr:hypothetical protein HMI55_005146 [Coelomomyces lativittatus]